jgi:hypothetical protein
MGWEGVILLYVKLALIGLMTIKNPPEAGKLV